MTTQDPECDDSYHASNGVTVLCPDASVGATGAVDGTTYTKRDRAALDSASASDLAITCTSGITNMYNVFGDDATFNEDISTWMSAALWKCRCLFVLRRSIKILEIGT